MNTGSSQSPYSSMTKRYLTVEPHKTSFLVILNEPKTVYFAIRQMKQWITSLPCVRGHFWPFDVKRRDSRTTSLSIADFICPPFPSRKYWRRSDYNSRQTPGWVRHEEISSQVWTHGGSRGTVCLFTARVAELESDHENVSLLPHTMVLLVFDMDHTQCLN